MPADLAKLLRWARAPEAPARAEAAYGLREHLDDAGARDMLGELARDADAEVRAHAAAALKMLEDIEQRPAKMAALFRGPPPLPQDERDARHAKGLRSRRTAPRGKPSVNYDAFLAKVREADYDPAIDYVHMLEPGDWARLEAELASLPADALRDFLAILGSGPPKGLRILARYLAGSDAELAEKAAEAIDDMAEVFGPDLVITKSEAALLAEQFDEFSDALRDVISRAVADDAAR
jgi:hypothetical protein